MAKFSDDSTIEAMLADIATCTRLVVCAGQPADFAGIAAVTLATVNLTPGDGNGDFVIRPGDVSGRKLSVLAQLEVAVAQAGNANHIALDNGVLLKYVTTATQRPLTLGGTVTVPEWDIEIEDPDSE